MDAAQTLIRLSAAEKFAAFLEREIIKKANLDELTSVVNKVFTDGLAVLQESLATLEKTTDALQAAIDLRNS